MGKQIKHKAAEDRPETGDSLCRFSFNRIRLSDSDKPISPDRASH